MRAMRAKDEIIGCQVDGLANRGGLLALQRHGITVETMDLSDLFDRLRSVKPEGDKYKARLELMTGYSSWEGVPGSAFDNIVRLGVALKDIADEMEQIGKLPQRP